MKNEDLPEMKTEKIHSFKVKCPLCERMVHMKVISTPDEKYFICPECDRVADKREEKNGIS